jgi:DoxX-like family
MKTIALYGLQMLVGLVALAAGYAKLTGMGFMAEPFAMIGLGKSFLMIAGTVEILAGLCLLFPRSGVVGALLLTTVMVGTMGASLGTAIGNRGEATHLVSQTTFRTTVQNDASVMPAVVVKKSQGWDI